jgi:hypothetical protein
VIENFTKNNSFNYDANQTFFGNIPDIKNIKISNIKNSLSATSQLSSIVIYETTFVLTDKNNQEIEKKYFLFLNYSQNFGYRIYEIKNENPNIEASL